MIKTILIEDEINVRSALKKILHIIEPKINIIAETGYVSEALTLINTHKPDLVFLDIELEDGNGFDILKQLQIIDFKIIFTTAYNQHAIKAFKYSAIDYLLKPMDPSDLQDAIKRVIIDIDNKKEHQNLLKILKENINNKEKKIVLKTTERRYIIAINDIIRLEAYGAYTIFVCKTQKITISKNLKYYQDLLTDDFIRCHQSHVINKKYILSINKGEKLKLSNNDLVPISIRKKSEIIQIVNEL